MAGHERSLRPRRYAQPPPVTHPGAGVVGTRSDGGSEVALWSLFELRDLLGRGTAELRFGPSAPASSLEGQWVKTIPGKGWFVY